MHELAAVGVMIDALVGGVAPYQPCRVDVVRVRRGSTFSDVALRQGFAMLAAGTPLEGAALEVETVDRLVTCECAAPRRVSARDLAGHLWVCWECGHVEEIADADDLQVIDVRVTPLDVPVAQEERECV